MYALHCFCIHSRGDDGVIVERVQSFRIGILCFNLSQTSDMVSFVCVQTAVFKKKHKKKDRRCWQDRWCLNKEENCHGMNIESNQNNESEVAES